MAAGGGTRAKQGDSSRWLILFALFVARTVMGCQFQTVGSTAPFLVHAYGVDFAQIGTLIGLYMLPLIFIALPGGAGVARDMTGSAAVPALFAAAMMALALLGLAGFRFAQSGLPMR